LLTLSFPFSSFCHFSLARSFLVCSSRKISS
jgi:hypothetical protein